MDLKFGVISPQTWGLAAVTELAENVEDEIGVSWAELERRARAATYEWLNSAV